MEQIRWRRLGFDGYKGNPSLRHLICSTCLHCFHQILAAVTNFAHIVPVLSSNSESVRKTGLVFSNELGFRCSIYQNRSEIFLDPSIPVLLGSEIFILVKKWSQDPFFVVTRFLSILSTSSKISTGHAFHLFKLIFSMVTSFVLLSEEKYQINKKKKSKNPKKQRQPKNKEKREGQKWNNI